MFFKKKKQKVEEAVQESVVPQPLYTQKENSELPTMEQILDGADPWELEVSYLNYHYSGYKYYYEPKVFDCYSSSWCDLGINCQKFIGVDGSEFIRLCREKFHVKLNKYSNPIFDTPEEAWKFIDNFRPYYHTFHVPRALMDRLSCYTPGGYKPYFLDKIPEKAIYEWEEGLGKYAKS